MSDVIVVGTEADRVLEITTRNGGIKGLAFHVGTSQHERLSDGALEEDARARRIENEIIGSPQMHRLEFGVVELGPIAIVHN